MLALGGVVIVSVSADRTRVAAASTASGGIRRALIDAQAGSSDQAGDAHAGQCFLQIFLVHEELLRGRLLEAPCYRFHLPPRAASYL